MTECLVVKGGKYLEGSVEITSAKNAILPILAGTVMCNGVTVIEKCTRYVDVDIMLDILEDIGCKVNREKDFIAIDCSTIQSSYIKDNFSKKIRSSIFMLGPLLSRFHYAKVAYPGGCNIGARPIDLHLDGLRSLNVKIEERHGYITCDGSNMRANSIHLDFPSVGATENIMMAAVLLKGTTTIYNVACEPEIEDLQNFLNAAGAKISGAGTKTITIDGVDRLYGTTYTPMSDRIIAGTYIIACAMSQGKIKLDNVIPEHNVALINKLRQAGCRFKISPTSIEMLCNKRLNSIAAIDTQVYPGFPTDLQSQILTLQTISRGTSVVTENLYETRFKVASELNKMGADITLNNKSAIVRGVPRLYGAEVTAGDLRGGAGLVIAGLKADGYTTVLGVEHIDRGYKAIECDLCRLNADITRKQIKM